MNISYTELNNDQIDIIKPLWNKLRDYHGELSIYFSEIYANTVFEERKKELLKKSKNGFLRIDTARNDETGRLIGYCISSISDELEGEVDSIFLEKDYRLSGIGDALMKRALNWMDENGVKTKKIVVAVGNEDLLSFYKRYNFLPRHLVLEQI